MNLLLSGNSNTSSFSFYDPFFKLQNGPLLLKNCEKADLIHRVKVKVPESYYPNISVDIITSIQQQIKTDSTTSFTKNQDIQLFGEEEDLSVVKFSPKVIVKTTIRVNSHKIGGFGSRDNIYVED